MLKFKPELLCPAGDLNRLKAAIQYGADAVYLAGLEFGMRTSPNNFSFEDLAYGVKYSHDNNVKVYLTCNTLPHNNEIARLPAFLERAADCGIDALIIADMGVLSLAKKYAPNVDIHISTQAGIVNYHTASCFYDMGAKRVVLARELPIEDIAEIKAKIPKGLELEAFIHGAMCMSFSGRCLISCYLTGRDANRGDCAQPCRWKYYVTEEKRPGEYFPIEENDKGTHLFNAQDMCMIEYIPQLVDAGIDSFKIEGRAKSVYYTAVTANAYRCAIDWHMNNDTSLPQWIIDETDKVSHRAYCTGFYFGQPHQEYENGGYVRNYEVIAQVEDYRDGRLYLSQRNKFLDGDIADLLQPGKQSEEIAMLDMQNENGEKIESAPHAAMAVSISFDHPVEKGSMIRRPKKV